MPKGSNPNSQQNLVAGKNKRPNAIRTTVNLNPETIETAKKLGNGQSSKGIDQMASVINSYGFCYVPGKGYWDGGWGEQAGFTKNIECAAMFHLDSPSLERAINDFEGQLERLLFNQSMQSRCY